MTKRQLDDIMKNYSPEELVESFVFPVKLTKKQKKEADASLNEALNARRAKQGAEERLKMTLLQLRFQIEDYVNDTRYDKRKNFGYFLKAYIEGLKIRQNEFAQEIDIKPAELSQYINNHRKPPQNIMIRLELHSHNMIPATDWYKLLEKENLHELSTNKVIRREEKKFIRKEAQLV